ncbi:MAG: ParB N-terminal domain-containing protein [Lentisphaerae bacterium]|nr:ParB N-terminal domain-containing protein [Lentisphaerota bacterium]
MNKTLKDMNIGDIVVRRRPRDEDGDLGDLVESIRTIGLLHPLIVDADNVLLAGGRRLAACRSAGFSTVPVFQLDVKADAMQRLNIQAGENLCRKALSPEELEKHIRTKTDMVRDRGGWAGFRARLARWFKG